MPFIKLGEIYIDKEKITSFDTARGYCDDKRVLATVATVGGQNIQKCISPSEWDHFLAEMTYAKNTDTSWMS